MRTEFLLLSLLLTACDPSGSTARWGGPSKGDATDPETGEGEGEGEAAAVALLSPADGATVDNPVVFTIQASGVTTVGLDADGYALGSTWDPSESDALSYTFNGTGYSRLITLTGYDADGTALATDSVSITVQADGVQLDVPYYYQEDNAYEPGSTCGITSGAMMVDTWHPGSVTPDTLYLDYGKSQGQSPSLLAALYEAEGLYADWTTQGSRADIRAQLDAGRPVAVHGWWTSAGHVTVIIGYDDDGWIVNDPAGDWYQGYFNPDGEAVHYPLDGEWDADMSEDGDLWYSVASDVAF